MPRDLLRTLDLDLRRRFAEVERILDALSVGISVAEDADCRRIRVNSALADWLGIAPQHALDVKDYESGALPYALVKDGRVLGYEDFPLRRAARDAAEIRDDDIEVVRGDGTRIVISVYATPLFADDGRPEGAVAIVTDVTERRRTEQQQRFLADASRVLSSSLEHGSTLEELAAIVAPVFGDYCAVDVLRDDGTFARMAFVNRVREKDEIAAALRRYPPTLHVDSPAARAIREGETVVDNECRPEMIQRAAQSAEHLELIQRYGPRAFMAVPLRARGRTLGLISVGTLGTARKYGERDVALLSDLAARAALALDNALLYQRAQDANRLKEDFLATLSHELRTPLNALLGWTHMLKSGALDEATRRRALDSVERNAQAQAVLINDILDVSRVMSGKLRLEEQPVDLQGVVLAAVDSVKPAVRAREIELGVSLAPVDGEVIGDPDRLQQVVWNLLSNAVKFTPPRGRVDLALEQTGGAVQIVVSDTGAGIDRAFLPHVFERFRQGDSSTTRSHGGLGLGLAIVRHLVDLHGGTVAVESEGPGTGSRFTVTLPVCHAAPAAAEEHAGAQPGAATLVGIRVLAVDDDQDSRELLLVVLRAAGADVMVVSSAATAVDAVEIFDPAVIVTDIAMPGMDGYAMARDIAARSRGSMPPIVALSAYAGADDVRRSAEAGFAVHLGKPVNYDLLVRTIADLAASARVA